MASGKTAPISKVTGESTATNVPPANSNIMAQVLTITTIALIAELRWTSKLYTAQIVDIDTTVYAFVARKAKWFTVLSTASI